MPSVADTYIENRVRVQPNHANNYGTVHGGNVMKWMDEYGAMSAMRFAGEACVTATVSDLDFEHPVPVGDIVVLESYVFDAGRTSVKTRVKAHRENPKTADRFQTSDSTFVYVAIDEEGRPIEVPDLTVESEQGEQWRQAALDRVE
jgi:acyl-CoA hydrolase